MLENTIVIEDLADATYAAVGPNRLIGLRCHGATTSLHEQNSKTNHFVIHAACTLKRSKPKFSIETITVTASGHRDLPDLRKGKNLRLSRPLVGAPLL